MRQIIKKAQEYKKPVYLCFIYEKAFDIVKWNILWKRLEQLGTPSHLVRLIESLYDSNSARVEVKGELTITFRTAKRVRQGCMLKECMHLSSTLFNA